LRTSSGSIERLGPEATDVIAPQLPDFKKQIGGLGKTLDSVPATRTVNLALSSLLERLGTPRPSLPGGVTRSRRSAI
jgi:hypothetical protein